MERADEKPNAMMIDEYTLPLSAVDRTLGYMSLDSLLSRFALTDGNAQNPPDWTLAIRCSNC